jgi:hypothetical protein
MSTDDLRFPPVGSTQVEETVTNVGGPLDLSVLARVSSQEQTPEPPPKPRDRPPGASRPKQRTRQPAKEAPTPRESVSADESDPIKDYRPGILVKPLRDLYVTVGTLVLPFNKPVGTAFIQNAEACAKSLDNAAKADKQIRRVLMLLIQGSVWGEVIVAHMPIMMALAVTLVPAVRSSLNGVQSEEGSTETVNPVSNGYMR